MRAEDSGALTSYFWEVVDNSGGKIIARFLRILCEIFAHFLRVFRRQTWYDGNVENCIERKQSSPYWWRAFLLENGMTKRILVGLMALSIRLDTLALRRGITTDAWNEKDHPRRPDGKFGTGGGKKKFDRKQKRQAVKLSKVEYARVMSELNTHLTKEERKKAIVQRAIGDYNYIIENNGFDNYRVIAKIKLD